MKNRLPAAAGILIAMLLGIVIGYMIFLNFPDKVAATRIAGYISIMGDASAVGRVFCKALGWFVTASLISLSVGFADAERTAGSSRGLGCTFIGVALVLFVFTSILYNYYLDENNLRFLLGDKRAAVIVYRCLVLLLILWSTAQYLGTVFAFADITMTLLAFFNLIALCCCSTSACACCVTMTGSARPASRRRSSTPASSRILICRRRIEKRWATSSPNLQRR